MGHRETGATDLVGYFGRIRIFHILMTRKHLHARQVLFRFRSLIPQQIASSKNFLNVPLTCKAGETLLFSNR